MTLDTVPTYPLPALSNSRLKGLNSQPPNRRSRILEKRSLGALWDLSKTAANAGDKVSELNAEITVEIAIVRANCL
ncbi:hypothetical protein D3C87_1555100 [compost metagenome]